MKCITVTFNTVDDAEFAVSALKNDFEFSYSFINDLETEPDVDYDNNAFVFANFYNYNNSNFLSPYGAIPIFNPYPIATDSINTNTDVSKSTSDVVVRIKCRDAFSEEIKNRLVNLNGRHIKII